jgi:hypothetical protein
MKHLKAPFPYFGGKSKVAPLVWQRFGKVDNYVEPFFGTGAVLFAAPKPAKVETVNDADGFLCNFWRAVQADPAAVAHYADWPVNEADLHARHYWLLTEGAALIAPLLGTPDGWDAKVAGWWVWGICSWIAQGWCSGDGPWQWRDGAWVDRNAGQGINRQLPHLGDAGQGINRKLPHLGNAGQGINRQLPHLGNAGQGINRQLPHLGNAGQGINRQLPHLGDAGRGINRKLPHLGNAGRGINRKLDAITDTMAALSERLRGVRVAHGDWSRVCGDSVTWRHGRTAVFLDPPYGDGSDSAAGLYANHDSTIAGQVRDWAIEAGKRPDMLICLAGYQGEHTMPDSWSALRWKAQGGFGNQGKGGSVANLNAAKETLWFSPACNAADQGMLL